VVQVYDSAKSGMQDPLRRGLTLAIRARVGTRTNSNTFPRRRKRPESAEGCSNRRAIRGIPVYWTLRRFFSRHPRNWGRRPQVTRRPIFDLFFLSLGYPPNFLDSCHERVGS